MKKILFIFCSLLLSLLSCTSPGSAGSKKNFTVVESVQQEINYQDSGKIIYNPDMGFYSVVKPIITKTSASQTATCELNTTSWDKTKYLTDGVYPSDGKSDSYKFDLIHVIVDLSSLSGNINDLSLTKDEIKKIKDKDGRWNLGQDRSEDLGKDILLTEADLSGVSNLLSEIYSKGKTAVIRFSYDPGNDGKTVKVNGKDVYYNVEPKDFDTILKHIEVICRVLKKHTGAVTAVECGMLGPYGEIHSTYFSEADKDKYVVMVMKKFMDEFNKNKINIPFLVRKPRFIENYSDKYGYDTRLGIYNDGYLGSARDLGTFKNRTDIKNEYTERIPYGGELCWDSNTTVRDDMAYWRTNLQDAVNEMKTVHLSFLNIGWNNHVLAWADSDDAEHSWKNSKGETKTISSPNKCINPFTGEAEKFFKIIIRHMGYRYVIINSLFDYYEGNNAFKVNLQITNNGFANIPFHRKKNIFIYLVEQNSTAIKCVEANSFFTGQSDLSFDVDCPDLVSGNYDVYLQVSDKDKSHYIQFANKSMWNENLNANRIGVFKKQ
ncbi:MAG: DUF4832 domain-containing protein [Treponema sp.]|uniref:DUF4832 domain-containing protein n=1 Tax=Treponema sp. TaxID=166 RepID=UPI00298EC49D|nr:DUF4832 domain-containing protein [Treponema sp.]MBR5933489.1 DUF4832 domain-containing protein [Treponema sp.]